MDLTETLHQLFRKQAARTPDALAVVDASHTYTYRQLDQTTDASRLGQLTMYAGADDIGRT